MNLDNKKQEGDWVGTAWDQVSHQTEIILPEEEGPVPIVVQAGAPLTKVAVVETETPPQESFLQKWATCFILLAISPIYCLLSVRFGLSGTLGSTLLFAFVPIFTLGLVYFLRKGKNKKRKAAIAGIVIAIAVGVILVLQVVYSPVVKGPQDIINSIGNSVDEVLTIQKTLAVSSNSQALEVAPTVTNQALDGSGLCAAIYSLMRIEGTRVILKAAPDWIGSADLNINVYWKVDGRSIKLNPNNVDVWEDFRSVKIVTIDYIVTIQNGQKDKYQCND